MQHRLRLTYPLVFPGCHPIRSGSLRSIRPLLSLSCSVLSLSSVPWRPSEILSSSVPHPFTILGGGGKCGHGTTKKTRESRSGRRPKGGGRTCVVAEKNCACLSLSLPLSPSLSGEKSDGRKKAAETDDEREEAAAAAAFGDTGSSIRGERRMDMRPLLSRPRPPAFPIFPLSRPSPFCCPSFPHSLAHSPFLTNATAVKRGNNFGALIGNPAD